MNREEWISRCSARLHAQWPTVPQEQLVEVAVEIQIKVQRQLEEPERAALEWLRQGIRTLRLVEMLADVRIMCSNGRRIPRERLKIMRPIRGEL